MTTSKGLLTYIKNSPSPFHAVLEAENMLKSQGFTELHMTKSWEMKKGGNYYVKPFGTTLFAVTVGEEVTEQQAFHIAAAHTDYPCLHIKPVAELTQKSYLRVNCEVYGGPILNTWLDRPLSVAGRVALRSENPYTPEMRFLNVEKPFLTVPNLAIHMNREVNKGVELKKQTDMLPLMGMLNDTLNEKNYFISFIAKQLDVKKEDILDFDLYVYNAEDGLMLGMNDEFIQSPRLDNLTSCYALVYGVLESKRKDGINVIALFDNEEIGSQTKQGANSALFSMFLEKIYESLGFTRTQFNEAVLRSFLLSVDVAHAMHPSHVEKNDPVNLSLMNEGVVFKINCNQRYTFDTEAVAVLQQLCEKNNIKFKKFVNHSDVVGGGTLGPIISSWLPMKTVDLGVPLLAMHSAREMMGTEDQGHLNQLMKVFFAS
ncbi:MAG: M18 family aminopeptidase [Clostridiales bacterium]|nr:M18 family aminopeptidase [Clostridiales bacterium]